MPKCKKCGNKVRVNYPFGKNSSKVETGHSKDCGKNENRN